MPAGPGATELPALPERHEGSADRRHLVRHPSGEGVLRFSIWASLTYLRARPSHSTTQFETLPLRRSFRYSHPQSNLTSRKDRRRGRVSNCVVKWLGRARRYVKLAQIEN